MGVISATLPRAHEVDDAREQRLQRSHVLSDRLDTEGE
jgi:hypothetical protein